MNKMTQALSEGLVKSGKKSKNIVVLNADFDSKIGVKDFAHNFADRYFNFGLAEANMMGASIGFLVRGKMPVVVGYGNFLGKCFDILKNGICVPNLNIKIIGVNCPELEGYDAKEAVDMASLLPNMKVYCPKNAKEVSENMEKIFNEYGPCFMKVE